MWSSASERCSSSSSRSVDGVPTTIPDVVVVVVISSNSTHRFRTDVTRQRRRYTLPMAPIVGLNKISWTITSVQPNYSCYEVGPTVHALDRGFHPHSVGMGFDAAFAKLLFGHLFSHRQNFAGGYMFCL